MNAAAKTLFILMFLATPLHAQEKIKTLDDLLQQVQQNHFQENQESKKREAAFGRKLNQQGRLLQEAKRELARLERRAKKLENVFNEKELQLSKLKSQLDKKLGAYASLFGLLREVARETQASLSQSLISGDRPNRAQALSPLIKTKTIPSPAQIKTLWRVSLDELVAQGRVVDFTSTLVDGNGTSFAAPITRIGPFVALFEGRYLAYTPETSTYRLLAKQPAGKFLSAAENTQDRAGAAGKIFTAAIDPARGGILALLIQTPSLLERVQQGGIIGYGIILLALFGLGLGVWRLLVLTRVKQAVEQQAANLQTLSSLNPLGRVLASVGGANQSRDALELKLDRAILRELPHLEKYLPLVKLFAAIAPLLGLLGTVTGMILTFQAITLFGTGEPKVMAAGISQALITTVLGLIAAVPLILLHASALAQARDIRHVLEEESAALSLAQNNGAK